MAERDPAMARYFAMTLVRIGGATLALAGLVMLGTGASFQHRVIGAVAFALGLGAMIFLPRALARRWRTPPAA